MATACPRRRRATDADAEAIVSIESLAHDDDTIVSIESLAPDDDTIVSIESLAPDDDTIVSIESLAPDDDAIVPIESLAPAWTAAIPADAPGTPGRLEVAYRALSLVTADRALYQAKSTGRNAVANEGAA